MIMKKREKAFTLIEILVALAVAAIFLPALGKTLTFAVTSSSQGDMYSQAYAKSQQDLEAMYYIKDNRADIWDWETIPSETSNSEYYQVAKSGDSWSLSGGKMTASSLSSVDGFTSSIQVFPVRRYADGELVENETDGAPDPYTKKVVSKVMWQGTNGVEEVSLSSYVTRH